MDTILFNVTNNNKTNSWYTVLHLDQDPEMGIIIYYYY